MRLSPPPLLLSLWVFSCSSTMYGNTAILFKFLLRLISCQFAFFDPTKANLCSRLDLATRSQSSSCRRSTCQIVIQSAQVASLRNETKPIESDPNTSALRETTQTEQSKTSQLNIARFACSNLAMFSLQTSGANFLACSQTHTHTHIIHSGPNYRTGEIELRPDLSLCACSNFSELTGSRIQPCLWQALANLVGHKWATERRRARDKHRHRHRHWDRDTEWAREEEEVREKERHRER